MKLKDILLINQMPIFLLYVAYLILLIVLFQGQVSFVFLIFNVVGMVAAFAISVAQCLPHEYGSVWVKLSLSRKELTHIYQGDLIPTDRIVGHFRNSTEFVNYAYTPFEQYRDVYVKVPVFNYIIGKFQDGWSGVFLWDQNTRAMILDALSLALRQLPPSYDNRIDIKVFPEALELVRSFPIEIEYTKIPNDYYGPVQSFLRILFTVAAAIPQVSINDVWDKFKDTIKRPFNKNKGNNQ